MVQAILAGRKTQTRRTKGLEITNERLAGHKATFDSINRHGECIIRVENLGYLFNTGKCPYGVPGDVLWVRETWTPLDTQEVDSAQLDEDGIPLEEFQVEIGYKDGMSKWCVFSEDFYDQMNEDIEDMEQEGTKWKPSIHMPKDAARIWLRIKDVRVERLQDITGQDAISEGVIFPPHGPSSLLESWGAAKKLFQNLWQSINGPDSWKDNPWVWVVEFERIEKPEL